MGLLAEYRGRCEERCAVFSCTLDEDAFLFSPAPDFSTPWPLRA
jgi:hypothetical protein